MLGNAHVGSLVLRLTPASLSDTCQMESASAIGSMDGFAIEPGRHFQSAGASACPIWSAT